MLIKKTSNPNFTELSIAKDGTLKPKHKFKSVDAAIAHNMGQKRVKSFKEAMKNVEKDLKE